MRSSLRAGREYHERYLLFVNYGCEGWSIMAEASSPQELLERVKQGIGDEWLIVKVLNITVKDEEES